VAVNAFRQGNTAGLNANDTGSSKIIKLFYQLMAEPINGQGKSLGADDDALLFHRWAKIRKYRKKENAFS
jgi:hypothetical protein